MESERMCVSRFVCALNPSNKVFGKLTSHMLLLWYNVELRSSCLDNSNINFLRHRKNLVNPYVVAGVADDEGR